MGFARLIALAHPDPTATTLHLKALDDYQVDLKLAESYTKPEVYRGLFVFYQKENRADEALNLLDTAFKVANRKEDEGPREEKDAAIERAMERVGYREGHIVADPAHLVLDQGRVGRLERAAVAALEPVRHRQVAPA